MPPTVDNLLAQGLSFHRAGNLAEAEAAYRQALQINHHHPDALHLLGVLACQAGHPDQGAQLIARAIEIDPKEIYRANLVRALFDLGKVDEAGVILRNQLPQGALPDLWQRYSESLYQAGRVQDALEAAREIALQHPTSVAALSNLGVCLMAAGKPEEAAVAYTQATALAPQTAAFHSNLCQALTRVGRFDEAIAAGQRGIQSDPNLAIAHNNLGVAFRDKGDLPHALSSFKNAIALAPDLADAHVNLAYVLFESGDYTAGWQQYEWRFQSPDFPTPPAVVGKPRWRGERLAGRTLLIQAEQGFGDILQFARYLPLLANRGGSIVLVCPPELRTLLSTLSGLDRIVAYTEPTPSFDVYLPLLSLPFILSAGSQIPAPSYVTPDTHLVARWSQKLAARSNRPCIGLAWAGNPNQFNAHFKRIPLASLASALANKDVTFFSLQTGPASQDLQSHIGNPPIIDLSPGLTDFSQTAAAIANLDLVITIDTAVAHVAGAMGKRTWLLLSSIADWRWPRGQPTSPWYPQTRIFRQSHLGDWTPVLADLTNALNEKTAESPDAQSPK